MTEKLQPSWGSHKVYTLTAFISYIKDHVTYFEAFTALCENSLQSAAGISFPTVSKQISVQLR